MNQLQNIVATLGTAVLFAFGSINVSASEHDTLKPYQTIQEFPISSTVFMGDVNNDRCPDLISIVSNGKNLGKQIYVLKGDCNGNFESLGYQTIQEFPISSTVFMGDVNNDSCLDLMSIVSNGYNDGSQKIYVLKGDCKGHFKPAEYPTKE